MMIFGISGIALPAGVRYGEAITAACMRVRNGFPPKFAYAIAQNETIGGEIAGLWNAATVISPDGGHGLFQLTSPVEDIPTDWQNPASNAYAAIMHWITPDLLFWADKGFTGEPLMRATAASFNAGIGGINPLTMEASGAYGGHLAHNDVDYFTTKSEGVGYGRRAVLHFESLG